MRKSARSCTKVDTASKVPALSKSVQVIDAIISHGPITIPQLIEVTGISRSSTYTLVGEMERLGLIHQDRFGRLVLWLKLISIGTMASRSFSLAEAVHPYLERLITHTPCIAAYFGMMSDGQGSYITKLTSKRTQIVAKSKVGEIVDLVHSGLGKCLLAFSDQSQSLLPASHGNGTRPYSPHGAAGYP